MCRRGQNLPTDERCGTCPCTLKDGSLALDSTAPQIGPEAELVTLVQIQAKKILCSTTGPCARLAWSLWKVGDDSFSK